MNLVLIFFLFVVFTSGATSIAQTSTGVFAEITQISATSDSLAESILAGIAPDSAQTVSVHSPKLAGSIGGGFYAEPYEYTARGALYVESQAEWNGHLLSVSFAEEPDLGSEHKDLSAGILYGKIWHTSSTHYSVSAGLGLAANVRNSRTSYDRVTVPSLVIELRHAITTSRVGIGSAITFNINAANILVYFTTFFTLGQFR